MTTTLPVPALIPCVWTEFVSAEARFSGEDGPEQLVVLSLETGENQITDFAMSLPNAIDATIDFINTMVTHGLFGRNAAKGIAKRLRQRHPHG